MGSCKKRTFKIEAYREPEALDAESVEQLWKTVESSIEDIYKNQASGCNFEESYRNAYRLVLHKQGEKLYSGLVQTTTSHLKDIAKSIEASQGALFLEDLSRKWDECNKALQMIRDILMYMDRTFIQINHKTPIHELGLNLWRDVIIRSNHIQTRLLDTLLQLVLRDRSGGVVDGEPMKRVIQMLSDLGAPVYEEDFEKFFLEASSNFFSEESRRLIECCNCNEYLTKVQLRLDEEIKRISRYLAPETRPKIIRVVEREMIENHMHRLVRMEGSGLVHMLILNESEGLKRMYDLFRHVPDGLTTMRDVMTSHLQETGTQLISDPNNLTNPIAFVQRLLDEMDKYRKMVEFSFYDDGNFRSAVDSSFQYLINTNSNSPEFLSVYVDQMLRRIEYRC